MPWQRKNKEQTRKREVKKLPLVLELLRKRERTKWEKSYFSFHIFERQTKRSLSNKELMKYIINFFYFEYFLIIDGEQITQAL
jgi:hypothetical protein